MRIGIDARTILNPDKGDAIGIGHYTYQLIKYLLKIDKQNEYVLFFDSRVQEKDVKKFSRGNVKIVFYPFSDYRKYLPGVYNEILGSATLVREKLDLIHATSPLSRIPVSYRGKTLVTVNDLGVFKVTDVFPRMYGLTNRAVISLMMNKADKIIAVSGSIKKDIQSIFNRKEEDIRVIYSGLDERFFEKPKISREELTSHFKIKDKYVLFLGTLEPVKNIVRLFEAFRIFQEKIRKDNVGEKIKLVMAGKRGWLAEEYRQIAKDLGIANDVVFTGYAVGEELVPLFHYAEFFVMPSLYEGFGTTVLEALATGAPVIASDVTSVPEIAGDAAILVNPLDTNQIADKMYELFKDEKLRKKLREKGEIQARKFDWEKCAQETLRLYQEMTENKQA